MQHSNTEIRSYNNIKTKVNNYHLIVIERTNWMLDVLLEMLDGEEYMMSPHYVTIEVNVSRTTHVISSRTQQSNTLQSVT